MRWRKGGSVAAGLLVLGVLFSLLFLQFPLFDWLIRSLERISYTFDLRHAHPEISAENPVLIVDIDDESLEIDGRWPWSRKKLAALTEKIQQAGARVVALSLVFPEPEPNPAAEIFEQLQNRVDASTLQAIREAESEFDYDRKFAEALSQGTSVLGFVFQKGEPPKGVLKKPLFELTSEEEKEALFLEESSYIANIAILQDAAAGEGFLNAEFDTDGVVRYMYGVVRKQDAVYPALALEAVRLFQGGEPARLVVGRYDRAPFVKAVAWGNTEVPLDAWGRMLIPYRGLPYSVPYLSAQDVLAGRVPRQLFEGKLVFIGSSATALGDVIPTPLSPIFASVEVHAHIAASILDGYFPHQPVWARRLSLIAAAVLGLLAAFLFPFLGPVVSSVLVLGAMSALFFLNFWIWSRWHLLIPGIFPLLVLFGVYGINEVVGYLFEERRRKEIKKMFGQYVPPERVEQLVEGEGKESWQGESKELTVLFSDIRNFTSVSEKMKATEVKEWLNAYFTPITKTIFEHKGTIDKYIGDMVMAFWGAPLEDPKHSLHAVLAGFAMLRDLEAFNREREKQGKPKMEIGVGINTGVMNVGDMGSAFRQAYTVLGDAVNTASRLEHETKEFGLPFLVGEATYLQTKEEIAYKKLDKIRLRGKEQGLLIYQPLGKQGEVSPLLLEEAKKHEEALEAYWARDWKKARALFEALKKEEKEVRTAERFLRLIETFEKTPPPTDWNGVSALFTDS